MSVIDLVSIIEQNDMKQNQQRFLPLSKTKKFVFPKEVVKNVFLRLKNLNKSLNMHLLKPKEILKLISDRLNEKFFPEAIIDFIYVDFVFTFDFRFNRNFFINKKARQIKYQRLISFDDLSSTRTDQALTYLRILVNGFLPFQIHFLIDFDMLDF